MEIRDQFAPSVCLGAKWLITQKLLNPVCFHLCSQFMHERWTVFVVGFRCALLFFTPNTTFIVVKTFVVIYGFASANFSWWALIWATARMMISLAPGAKTTKTTIDRKWLWIGKFCKFSDAFSTWDQLDSVQCQKQQKHIEQQKCCHDGSLWVDTMNRRD